MTGDATSGDRIEALAALLLRAEEAHASYETIELDGVYDEAWPRWYADHAVEHGIGAIVGHPIAADRLAQFLGRAFAEFKAADPQPTEPWATYTARRIAAEL